MDIAAAATPENLSQSFMRNSLEYSSSPSINQRQYHEVVLQIPPDQTEEDVERELIGIAQEIGLDISSDMHPQFDISRYANYFPASSSHFHFGSPPLTSTSYCYGNNNVISSPPTLSSSNEIAGSMYSTTSISTRPTSPGSVLEQPCTLPALSRPRQFHRSSLSSSRNRPGSCEKRVRFSNFRLSFGKFPHFRRRSAAAVQSPASPAWFDTRPITPGPDNLQAQCSQAKLGKLMPQHNNSASINHSNEEDNPAMMETLNCPQLQKLRSVQEAQRDRHLAFKEDTLESLYLRHEESKSLKRREHQRIERDIDDQNIQEANRLEELQLDAELDLVEELRRERQTLEIRIHHMEGYLAASPQHPQSWLLDNDMEDPPPIQPRHRHVTQKDRDHLLERYRERDRMDTLHMSKIKVLRDTQERKYQETMSRQEKKASKVADINEKDFQNLVSRCNNETTVTSTWFLSQEQHLKTRWMLEEAIVRKRLENDTGIYYIPLPIISFSEEYENGNSP
ncbi:conserved hypothetical protein [Histoplasma capsulatum var. duboisii H88]|uniref:IBR domain-containing protein n=1 Tax=Ajellomyces capsulatus (strain H88) TaxID=544711 RepID=F0U8F2_AJEC8|nr:conserved hypothetical protein [Histoplasma capsulatum var. duboisii H88]QSS51873.1 hypothetical protein I7I53_07321 [Histoplasma capsulatum var. duboisii H88]